MRISHRSYRKLVVTALLAGLPVIPLVAQGTAKQATIAPEAQASLWPTVKLGAVKQELKDRIVAMRDTLINLSASIEATDRARRSRNTPAVLMSRTRALSSDCGRVERNATEFAEFAATLRTDNEEFGQPAVQIFRTAVAKLVAAATECRLESDRLSKNSASLDPDQVLRVLNATRPVIDDYGEAARGLGRTLRLSIDATERS